MVVSIGGPSLMNTDTTTIIFPPAEDCASIFHVFAGAYPVRGSITGTYYRRDIIVCK